jgi:hypothetical protein
MLAHMMNSVFCTFMSPEAQSDANLALAWLKGVSCIVRYLEPLPRSVRAASVGRDQTTDRQSKFVRVVEPPPSHHACEYDPHLCVPWPPPSLTFSIVTGAHKYTNDGNATRPIRSGQIKTAGPAGFPTRVHTVQM